MSRKQRKIEKEIRARKAAEEKNAREEAEKERLANRTPKEKAEDNKRTALGCGAIILVLVLVGACGSIVSGDDEDESAATDTSTSASAPADPTTEETKSEEPAAEQTETETEEATAESSDGGAEEWLLEQMGSDSWTDILMSDPTLWGGYVNGSEVSHGVWHVRLQVDREQDKELGERAAHAIANLVRFDHDDPRVKDIDWVVVEDGAGVVIAQESV